LIRAVLDLERAVRLLARITEWIPAVRGAQDSATQMGDAADRFLCERNHLVLAEQPREAAPDTHNVPSTIDCGEDGRPNDGVEPRSVAAAGGNCNSHQVARYPGEEALCDRRVTCRAGSCPLRALSPRATL